MLDTMLKISLTLVAFDKMSRVIKDAVRKSNDEFSKLQKEIQKTSQMFDDMGRKITALGAGVTAVGVGLAHQMGMTKAVQEAFQLEHQLRELGNVGQLTNGQIADMDKRLGVLSKNTNQYRSELAEGLNVLVASGIAPEAALDYMNVIERTATAAQAEIVDISKTAFAVTDNLKVNVNDLGKTMDILAQAGKEGRFELKDMAAAFPSLTAGASMLGMKGVPAVTELGAALQVAMKGAGSAQEAANNLENFIQDITSPLAVNRFKELYQIDIQRFLIQTLNASKDPIEELVKLINQLTDGDVFAVSEIFRNKTVLNFLKPMMQNLEEYQRIKNSTLSADGIMDSDYTHMMETTIEQWKQLRINMKELVFPHLHAPLAAINNILSKINSNPMMQKGLFFAIVGTIDVGLFLTAIGTTSILIGKMAAGYGKFLSMAKDLSPVLVQNAAKLLEFIGLNSASHNLTYGFKIAQSGDKLGLGSAFSLKGGLMADIRRIDNNLRTGITKGFKELPTNIANSAAALTLRLSHSVINFVSTAWLNLRRQVAKFRAMLSTSFFVKNWAVTSVKAIPTNFIAGLNALKNGFLNIPSMIKTAIVSFRAFSLTLLTSPLGWIALSIAGVAFVIYKYWKPITGFFKGMWQGLKEGLQPLMPLFNKLGNALAPIIQPIKAVWDWLKKLFKPVDDIGGKAENMGVKFGKAIANIIVKLVSLVQKAFEVGAKMRIAGRECREAVLSVTRLSPGTKIGDMLTFGLLSKTGKTQAAIGKHAQIIRDHLPHSPAKTGPLKDLHKIKISETIASSIKASPLSRALSGMLEQALHSTRSLAIKPLPIITAMNNTLSLTKELAKAEGRSLATCLRSIGKAVEVKPITDCTMRSVKTNGLRANVRGANSGNSSTVINYNPTITLSGASPSVKDDFAAMLRKHKDEILSLVRKENERKLRLAY